MDRRLRHALFGICCAALLCGNRTPPLWQGSIENRSLSASVKCVRDTLSKVRIASVSWGPEPEYGDVRVFFRVGRRGTHSNPLFQSIPGAKAFRPEIMVALTQYPGGVAIYMDADNRESSKRMWRGIEKHCGVTG
jgi:hypothetical protein